MSQPDLSTLFDQLGLPSDAGSIDRFVGSHALLKGQVLSEAPWWNRTQAAFLAEALEEDADWSPVVDLLANLLRTEAG